MTKEEKSQVVASLTEKLQEYPHFYLVDLGGLNAADTSDLRRKCFEGGVELRVVKNTLFKRALVANDQESVCEELNDVLKGETAVFFTQVGNVPARLVKDFRKSHEKPILKAAYVEESVYVGDNQLDTLATLKSREELIADVVALLQSPAKNVISALQSGGQTLTGLLKTLGEREEK
ncbi:MAG: 50S ribosomal protein L10 [Bacteroidetes bacterium]|nr:MAG: 50S ribosomal protein L10 [Bacteroidota bacterium]